MFFVVTGNGRNGAVAVTCDRAPVRQDDPPFPANIRTVRVGTPPRRRMRGWAFPCPYDRTR